MWRSVTSAELPTPQGYSRAVVVEARRFLLTSMTAPVASDGSVVGVGAATSQARQVLKNIRSLLDSGGAEMSDVVSLSVYATSDLALSEAIAVISSELRYPFPTLAVAVVEALANPEFMVEIAATAVLP